MAFSHGGRDDADPRLTGEFVRRVDETTLVGVVHDHPASIHRVRRATEAVSPDTLALELPPVAVPLFEQYARSAQTPPAFGGEMSAAIQATDASTVVGIDRPSSGFFGQLGRNLVRDRPAAGTVRTVLRNALSAVTHAAVCRAAATIATHCGVRLEVDSPVTHDASWDDTPETQARDEQRQVRKSRAFMDAVQPTGARRAAAFTDATREDHMASRLADCRDTPVLAVVGIDHLEPLADALA